MHLLVFRINFLPHSVNLFLIILFSLFSTEFSKLITAEFSKLIIIITAVIVHNS